MSDRLRTAVITVVTVVWATNFAASLVLEDYRPSESINGIFMAIVGGLFALGAREGAKRDGGDNGGGAPKETPPEGGA